MNICSRMRRCPASLYYICPAFSVGTNCWEERDVPCCRRNDKSRCAQCTLYAAFLIGDRSQIYPETVHV